MPSARRFSPARWVVYVLPIAAVLSVLAVLHPPTDYEAYLKHREFWQGNPSEVYSHWVDMVLMSGNAVLLSWLVAVEGFLRPRHSDTGSLVRRTHACAAGVMVMSGVVGVALDQAHGEGTVIIVYPIFFLPILLTSYYLLRQSAAALNWRPRAIGVISAAHAAIHAGAQLFYEPSEAGGPNGLVIPIWLCVVLSAFSVALWKRRRQRMIKPA
jgi:hypothetical protein